MTIRLYNTMARQKETFVPREEGKVSIYACGPTTYNFFHLGNARMLVVFDMVRRYFMYRGYEVNYVQNFTDVDDKIIKKADEEGCDPFSLAQKYIGEYFKDARALHILPATVHPKATEHITEMLEIIKVLEKKGLAYNVDGNVYFAVERFPGYGKLSGRSLEDMQAGARVDVNEQKINAMDFALWKKAKTGEPAWDSPWGQGRPGWHIECSAMSLKYLGAGFDIHGGGGDLVFPHHENEIAQAEGYLEEQTFARYWMHNAFIMVNEEKMSKSLGNFFLIREVLEKYPGDVVRFYLLGTHYRSPLDFDEEKLAMASKGLERLKTSLRLADEALRNHRGRDRAQRDIALEMTTQKAKNAFEEAMDDDFNSAQAYAALFDLAREMNVYLSAGDTEAAALSKARQMLASLAATLGFDLSVGTEDKQRAKDDKLSKVMALVLEMRAAARKNKDWQTADLIRDSLKEAGIVIEDTPQGARWYVK